MYQEAFDLLLTPLPDACRAVYGDRLLSLAVFGSVARGAMRADSDIDLLVIAEPLPHGRMPRVVEFEQVEERLVAPMAVAKVRGLHTSFSPVFRTPDELQQGGLLFLDMTDQARILLDRDGLLRGYLDGLKSRLDAMGARRVPKGGGYYWLLKPDFRPGDRIEL